MGPRAALFFGLLQFVALLAIESLAGFLGSFVDPALAGEAGLGFVVAVCRASAALALVLRAVAALTARIFTDPGLSALLLLAAGLAALLLLLALRLALALLLLAPRLLLLTLRLTFALLLLARGISAAAAPVPGLPHPVVSARSSWTNSSF